MASMAHWMMPFATSAFSSSPFLASSLPLPRTAAADTPVMPATTRQTSTRSPPRQEDEEYAEATGSTRPTTTAGQGRQSTEVKRKKNASAQADFRKRRKEYLVQLETSYEESLQLVQHLTELHRKAAEETRLYRERNINLDATIADLRAQLERAQQALPPPSPTLALQPEHSLVFGHQEPDSYLTRPSTPIEDIFAAPTVDYSLPDLTSVPAFVDTFNLYADADAPVRPTSYISAPVHHPYTANEMTVSAGTMPALTFSPESLPDDLAPVTPPSLTRQQSLDPFAEYLTATAPIKPNTSTPGSLAASLRANSLPNRSAKCSAQLTLMRQLVREAETDRLGLGMGLLGEGGGVEEDGQRKRRRTSS